MKLKWTKSGRDWFAIHGKFRAEVKGPNGPLGFCHWSVRAGDRSGGSGGTSSVQQSKRSAENEVERFARMLAAHSDNTLAGSAKTRVSR